MTAVQDGWAAYRAGAYQDALSIFASARTADPDDYSAVLGSGRCHRLLGELDAAVADFTRAHGLRPMAARPLCERGAITILQHRWEETLADYRAAEALEPDYPGLCSYFAELYLFSGRPADALALSVQATADEPGNLMNPVNVAHARLLLGDMAAALADYRRLAREFHPVKRQFGADIAEHDLDLLEAAGVYVPERALVTAALREGH